MSVRTEGRVLGGGSTALIESNADAVMAALDSADAFWHVLPRVVAVEEIPDDTADQVLRITHAVGPFRGGYVLRVRRDPGAHTIRFWVDTRYPRDVRDAWGYFELRPRGPSRSLLVYQVRAELSPGLVSLLFSDRIQRALMTVPARVRTFVESSGEISR